MVYVLVGFKKEELRVQVNDQRILTIFGQRLLDEANTWSRFTKQLKVPLDCNEDGIRAKFSNGILTIIMPKRLPSSTTSSTSSDQQYQSTKTPKPRCDHHNRQEISITREPKSDNIYERNTDNKKYFNGHEHDDGTAATQRTTDKDKEKNKSSSLFRTVAEVATVVLVFALSGAYLRCWYNHRSNYEN